jgi:GT2 family glycosyltransferase
MQTKLSISIVTFNNIKTINQCIESLIKYLPPEINSSIYIIDNASSDNTYATLCQLENKYKIIKIKKMSKNIGYGMAHNSVLSILESDFHLYCNPDIIAKKNFIEPLVELLNDDKEIGLVVPKILDLAGAHQFLCRRYPGISDLILRRSPQFLKKIFIKKLKHYEMKDVDSSKNIEVQCASGAFVLCRTPYLKLIKGFDSRYFLYFEDFDMTRNFQINSFKTVYTPNAEVFHEGGYASRKSVKIAFIHLISAVKYFYKWGLKL